MAEYGVHWFRRDLPVAGNPALQYNWQKNSGKVVGFFCFDPSFLSRPDFSPDRFAFFLQTLRALRDELRARGSDLLVLDAGPEKAFARLFENTKARPNLVTWNRDYEPFARKRDETMTRLFQTQWECGVWNEPDHLLVEPTEIEKTGNPYQVYTPFAKKWMEAFRTEKVQDRIEAQKAPAKKFSLKWKDVLVRQLPDALEPTIETVKPRIPLPLAGAAAAAKALESFSTRIKNYASDRDLPATAGTSQLSIYFKNGSLTVAQAIAYLKLGKTPSKFLSELIWREFYYYILFHYPHVETTAFQERFRDLKWENSQKWFEAWKTGQTGFPIVDAGMRQLNATGWMHNRVRMIVASFLTKDLLIDWKWGERYFMERLLDGDLAPNNGGWQWAASTGCDAQPYFRIFNPKLQEERFDPKGEYVRRWIPELGTAEYPKPIVDHAVQRARALALYSALAKSR